MFFLNQFLEREEEKHQCERSTDQLPPICAPTADQTCNLGTWPGNLLVPRTMLQSTEVPAGPGPFPGIWGVRPVVSRHTWRGKEWNQGVTARGRGEAAPGRRERQRRHTATFLAKCND